MSGVLRGRCGDCGHIWVIAYLPMPIAKVARLGQRAACPMCACSKVFIATAESPMPPEPHPETPEITRVT